MATGPPTLPYIAANGGLDHEFVARLNSEIYPVADLAGDPAVFGHTRNDSKAHAGRIADDIKGREHDRNALNDADIESERIGVHRELPRAQTYATFGPYQSAASSKRLFCLERLG
ncbi:MAG: hypothetical protein WDN29_10165 [Methylovirgula sp.]